VEAIAEGRQPRILDRQAAAKRHTSRLGRPTHCVRISSHVRLNLASV
jgi:hypothetical protein